MSKIICDVCGTTYPDSANQCPICGCVRPVGVACAEGVRDEAGSSRRENYTYVKGGRFSKKNVKKRNQRNLQQDQQPQMVDVPQEIEEKEDSGRGLVVAIIVLLIAVIAVASYITIRFFLPVGGQSDQTVTPPETTIPAIQDTETIETTVETIPDVVACTGITLSATEVTLENSGEEYTLNVTISPENTSEELAFNSQNDAIATISNDGKITAISNGETSIIVSCGEISAECKVVCKFKNDSADSSADSDTTFKAPYRLNKSDVTIEVGKGFNLFFRDANGNNIPVTFEIKKPDVCTVEGNKVTGTARGTTKISVTYNGETYSCIVRVI